MEFNVLDTNRETRARRGLLRLGNRCIETPAFMPVGTRASVKTLAPWDLDEVGAGIVLANT